MAKITIGGGRMSIGGGKRTGRVNPGISRYYMHGGHGGRINTKYIDFGGTDEYVTFGNNLNLGAGDFSLSFWAYIASAQDGVLTYILSKYQGANDFYYMRVSSNRFSFIAKDSSVEMLNLTSNLNTTFDAWFHIVLTADRDGDAYWYQNGAVFSAAGSPDTTNITNTGNFYLARHASNYGIFKMDDFCHYSKVLTSDDIAYLYGGGTPQTSGNPQFITNPTFCTTFDNDTIPTITDTQGGLTGTATNMEAADIKTY